MHPPSIHCKYGNRTRLLYLNLCGAFVLHQWYEQLIAPLRLVCRLMRSRGHTGVLTLTLGRAFSTSLSCFITP
jgi:hypothetical protein